MQPQAVAGGFRYLCVSVAFRCGDQTVAVALSRGRTSVAHAHGDVISLAQARAARPRWKDLPFKRFLPSPITPIHPFLLFFPLSIMKFSVATVACVALLLPAQGSASWFHEDKRAFAQLFARLSFSPPSVADQRLSFLPSADYTNWDVAKLSAFLTEKGIQLPEAPSQAQL
jgi:hypothetical protein